VPALGKVESHESALAPRLGSNGADAYLRLAPLGARAGSVETRSSSRIETGASAGASDNVWW
jgi:hypothetical protein